MREYSFDEVKVNWAGIPLSNGLAAGSSIKFTPTRSTWEYKDDGMGGVVAVFHPSLSGNLVLVMDQESLEHQLLVNIVTADRFARLLAPPLVVVDLLTRETIILTSARPEVIPGFARSSSSDTIAWTFLVEAVIPLALGFNNNVVGT